MPVCDACHAARALTLWANVDHEEHDDQLDLCGHDSDRLADALVHADWCLIADERVDRLEPVTA